MLKWIFLRACGCILISSSVNAKNPVLTPRQDFSSPLLQVYSPDSEGWSIRTRSNALLAFEKPGTAADQTYVATVQFFHLAAFPDAEAFTEFVREAVVKEAPTERFEILQSDVHYSEDRPYPCVKYRGVSVDKKSHVSLFVSKRLKFQMIALYCQHPNRPGVGFAVTYSSRGEVEQNLDADAASFIDSVQITPVAVAKP